MTSKSNFISRLTKIIGDEHEECTSKYVKLSNDFKEAGMLVIGEVVDDIKTQECEHERIYRLILKDLRETEFLGDLRANSR